MRSRRTTINAETAETAENNFSAISALNVVGRAGPLIASAQSSDSHPRPAPRRRQGCAAAGIRRDTRGNGAPIADETSLAVFLDDCDRTPRDVIGIEEPERKSLFRDRFLLQPRVRYRAQLVHDRRHILAIDDAKGGAGLLEISDGLPMRASPCDNNRSAAPRAAATVGDGSGSSQLLVSAIDWALAAAVLYVLLPPSSRPSQNVVAYATMTRDSSAAVTPQRAWKR